MESYSDNRNEHSSVENKKILVLPRENDSVVVSQANEIRERFGITTPDLLAKALRISVSQAKNLLSSTGVGIFIRDGGEKYERD